MFKREISKSCVAGQDWRCHQKYSLGLDRDLCKKNLQISLEVSKNKNQYVSKCTQVSKLQGRTLKVAKRLQK